MNLDDYGALVRGKLTPRRGLESVITTVAAGVYVYMVMLKLADRQLEARFFNDIRERAFSIRAKICDAPTQELERLSNEMTEIYRDLNTAYLFLQAHKPDEACVLQSVVNTACGLIHSIKFFKDI